jgi:hypothetical protein
MHGITGVAGGKAPQEASTDSKSTMREVKDVPREIEDAGLAVYV